MTVDNPARPPTGSGSFVALFYSRPSDSEKDGACTARIERKHLRANERTTPCSSFRSLGSVDQRGYFPSGGCQPAATHSRLTETAIQ